MTVTRKLVSNFFFVVAVVLLIVALMGKPAHGQTKKPEAEPQSVYYPDPCTLLEEGSWGWYLQLCMFK